jgi:hypothetical protein
MATNLQQQQLVAVHETPNSPHEEQNGVCDHQCLEQLNDQNWGIGIGIGWQKSVSKLVIGERRKAHWGKTTTTNKRRSNFANTIHICNSCQEPSLKSQVSQSAHRHE